MSGPRLEMDRQLTLLLRRGIPPLVTLVVASALLIAILAHPAAGIILIATE